MKDNACGGEVQPPPLVPEKERGAPLPRRLSLPAVPGYVYRFTLRRA